MTNKDSNAVKWRQWGEGLEPEAVRQMENACSLPVALAGALMPDAHLGYGLPIGGVLAVHNAVIPYAVGVDIACRMRMSIYDHPADRIPGMRDKLKNALRRETRFGVGSVFKPRRDHDVMDDPAWNATSTARGLRNRAWDQLGTSGSGNHFVEFGDFTIGSAEAASLGIEAGVYLSLLSHSGSRGAGAQVCREYSRRAQMQHKNLAKNLKHLAWLPLDKADGLEYWSDMSLMGRYAAANHELIHKHVSRAIGLKPALSIENHHNFAWIEEHKVHGKPREMVVHRKGATPAAKGVLGIIPGSMATPGFVVRGKGDTPSLHSAAHGAGRVMSRTQAKQSFTWHEVRKQLEDAGVELISAGLDEVPGVYKDIHSVMDAQKDLVDVLGRFDPRIVMMCPPGHRAED